MALQVHRIGYALGAEITGLDLRQPLDHETIAEIRQAWYAHMTLCFRDQDLTKDEFLRFAQHFEGELDEFGTERSVDPSDPRILFLSSKPEPGKKWDGYKQGVHWHSDRSYTDRPATGTFVLAKEIPEVGGDTMFANQYMAYETLSDKLKDVVAGLSAIHDQANISAAGVKATDSVVASYRLKAVSAVHPIVKEHPATGRRALYVGSRIKQFVGMTEEESAPLIGFLNQHAVRYEFVYRHRWQPRDLVMWDNRCLMHYAPLDYDPQTQPRFMWRCSLVGPQTGSAIPVRAPAAAGAG